MDTQKVASHLQNDIDFYKSLQTPLTIKKEATDFSFNNEQLKAETKSIKDLLAFKMTSQFQLLNAITSTQNHKNNMNQENITLDYNRYSNILPYKHSIVKLQGNNEQDQYINANYIGSPFKDKTFIATQGPIPNTFMKFWRMAWEQNVGLIMMVCKEREQNMVKCDQYWPSQGSVLSEGNLSIKLIDTVKKPELNIIERTFSIQNGKEQRQITQVHWEGWPDHGIPESKDYQVLENLVLRVISQIEQQKIPIVHCSAGVGRTGTLIGLTNIYMTLKYHAAHNTPIDKIELNVLDIIRRMREQRLMMVQTDSQLGLIYEITKQFIRKLLKV